MNTPNVCPRMIIVLLSVVAPFAALNEGRAGRPTVTDSTSPLVVYIGSYAERDAEGIHLCRLDRQSGELTRLGGVSGVKNPSFQALHPNGRFLYTVGESEDFHGGHSGSVGAFAIDSATGNLTYLNQESAMGTGPCHLIVDRAGKHVLAANYGGGSVVVLPIESDGRVGVACAFNQHEGSSVHPRQTSPHAHCINNDDADRFVIAADLGLDKLLIYRYDLQHGSIAPNPEMPFATVTPGAGPRHFAFHPGGQFAYVINELNSTVTAFRYDAVPGTLTTLQEISTLPDGFTGQSTTAEIAVSPDGRFVYGSNRGHDSIVVYAVDAASGKLSLVSHHSTQGQQPRNFAIDPSGTFLLAANQRTGNVVVFRVDRATGKLNPTGHQLQLTKPVCVTFWTPAQ